MSEIRSYRRVFDLERRIYRIDRLRLNPNGVPLRGLVYLVVIVASVSVLAHLPGLSELLSLAPWYARYLGLPAAAAALLAIIRVEGRTFHVAALAVARRLVEPRLLASFRSVAEPGRWRPREVIFIADGSEGRVPRMSYRGPGLLVVRSGKGGGLVLDVGERARTRPPQRSEP